jgi:predicted ribosomally synthesized peptide with nif11-like leader
VSQQSLEKFLEKVAQSEELQTQIGEEINGDALIALGAEHGFEFNTEELNELSSEPTELTDDVLDSVAGGIMNSALKADGVMNGALRPGIMNGAFRLSFSELSDISRN